MAWRHWPGGESPEPYYQYERGPVLEYGDTVTVAAPDGATLFRCDSEIVGVTCTSLVIGRGFFLNRDELRTF